MYASLLSQRRSKRYLTRVTLVFGARYEVEVTKDDDFWRGRALNPQASSFLALDVSTDAVLSSLTMIRDIPLSLAVRMKYGLGLSAAPGDDSIVTWAVNAVYTAKEARRKGMSAALLKASLEHTARISKEGKKDSVVTVQTLSGNDVAKRMYEKAGFEVVQHIAGDKDHCLLALLQPFDAAESNGDV